VSCPANRGRRSGVSAPSAGAVPDKKLGGHLGAIWENVLVPDLTQAAQPRVFDRRHVRLVDPLAARGGNPFAGPRRSRALARGQTAHRPGPAGSAYADPRTALDCTRRRRSSAYALIRGAGTRGAPTSSAIRMFVIHSTAVAAWMAVERETAHARAASRTIESDETEQRRHMGSPAPSSALDVRTASSGRDRRPESVDRV
jgi:hypothetical protein